MLVAAPPQAHAEVLQQPYAAAAAPFFRPSTFLRLERDGAGAVSLPLLLQYISLSAVGQRLVSDAALSTAAAAQRRLSQLLQRLHCAHRAVRALGAGSLLPTPLSPTPAWHGCRRASRIAAPAAG